MFRRLISVILLLGIGFLGLGCGESWPRYSPVEEMVCDRPEAPSEKLEFRYVTTEFHAKIFDDLSPSDRQIRWSSDSPWEIEAIDERYEKLRDGPGWPVSKSDAPFSFAECSSEWTVSRKWTVNTSGQSGGIVTPSTTQPKIATTRAPTTTKPDLESVSEQNARRMAAEYLEYSAFSRSGLIDQLKYEGFTATQAEYGVDAQSVNWNTQAALMAAEYLEYSAFSRSGLIDQLKYEGFTASQAKYGVDASGL